TRATAGRGPVRSRPWPVTASRWCPRRSTSSASSRPTKTVGPATAVRTWWPAPVRAGVRAWAHRHAGGRPHEQMRRWLVAPLLVLGVGCGLGAPPTTTPATIPTAAVQPSVVLQPPAGPASATATPARQAAAPAQPAQAKPPEQPEPTAPAPPTVTPPPAPTPAATAATEPPATVPSPTRPSVPQTPTGTAADSGLLRAAVATRTPTRAPLM